VETCPRLQLDEDRKWIELLTLKCCNIIRFGNIRTVKSKCYRFIKTVTWNSPLSGLVTSANSWHCVMHENTAKKYNEILQFLVTDFAEDGTPLVCRSVVLVRAIGGFCSPPLFFCRFGRTLS
jgi:hypothetical protein